ISVTLTRKPVTGTEVIDPVKGDSFVYNYAKGKVTLSGGVTPATPVFIAVYDDGGRMLSCSIRTSPGIVDVSGGSKARLIWMSAAGFIAKVKCIEIDIK
ncbi:MAG: hypothetical protein II705_06515, partial [Clostridia bacterium]|nr:hypothetical protein [Clostridia bacterium]